ncbi:DUF1295 domain-containing protein [Sporichthya polymorpha]|uniref:DUF1295 domain-containing protein n=1 Tax=Sporichthya polymorpha TaxID=35751 RepID=UPI0003711D54|nr:DUF1295 domain-containing protein [Sporichthya polymorpha]
MTGFGIGLAVSAAAVVLLMAGTFAVARKAGKHSVVDVSWGLGFAAVALSSLAVATGNGTRSVLLAGMVVLWGGRLAWHIGRRNAGHGEDPRYSELLSKAPPERRTAYALRMIYGLQGVLILVISLPVQVGMHADAELGPLAVLGVAVWGLGLFFEAVGDHQLQAFKSDPANRGKVLDRGLWRWTRHPNYFGDACVWWGIWLVAAETGVGALTVLSPIVMTFFLTKGTGAALTEKRMAGRPGFAEYARRTSGFVPLPPKQR